MIGRIAGKMLIEDLNWVDKVQVKTHRKRRINKKWAKRYGFKVTPKRDFAWIGDCLIGHPAVIRDLMQIIEEAGKLGRDSGPTNQSATLRLSDYLS